MSGHLEDALGPYIDPHREHVNRWGEPMERRKEDRRQDPERLRMTFSHTDACSYWEALYVAAEAARTPLWAQELTILRHHLEADGILVWGTNWWTDG